MDVENIEVVQENELDEEEVKRRLPEVEKIDNVEIRGKTIQAFVDLCPDYFWQVPASTTGKYHPEDTTGKYGLWIHTKRAFTAFERLADSAVEGSVIAEIGADRGRAAILLHDMYKQGNPPQGHTVDNHGEICADILSRYTDFRREVIDCVKTHNGPWSHVRKPQTWLEALHHWADMVASDRKSRFRLYKPTPELQEQADFY